jgi:hypothetical protein
MRQLCEALEVAVDCRRWASTFALARNELVRRGRTSAPTPPAFLEQGGVSLAAHRCLTSVSAVDNGARSRLQRRADTMARLENDADIWVATASGDRPHLVPLSFAWDGARIILATPSDSPTARYAARSGLVRLALGTARDVTVFDATTTVVPCPEAAGDVAEAYLRRVGWDPRDEELEHSFLIASPTTARAWRNVPELKGRTIMRDGHWLEQ